MKNENRNVTTTVHNGSTYPQIELIKKSNRSYTHPVPRLYAIYERRNYKELEILQ